MTPLESEITELEERLRLAELGPDPAFFEEFVADAAVIVSDGEPAFAKPRIVAAHRPGAGPKFTRVEMRNTRIVDHGAAAVVTCDGTYATDGGAMTLTFMRVWVKTGARWQIVAGTVSSPPNG